MASAISAARGSSATSSMLACPAATTNGLASRLLPREARARPHGEDRPAAEDRRNPDRHTHTAVRRAHAQPGFQARGQGALRRYLGVTGRQAAARAAARAAAPDSHSAWPATTACHSRAPTSTTNGSNATVSTLACPTCRPLTGMAPASREHRHGSTAQL